MTTITMHLEGRASAITDETPVVSADLPDDFASAAAAWGEEVCEKIFADAVKDKVLSFAKSRLRAGLPLDVIQGAVDTWTPGVRGPRAGRKPAKPVSSALRALGKLSEEDIAALKAQLSEDPRFTALVAA